MTLPAESASHFPAPDDQGPDLFDLAITLARQWKLLLGGPLVSAAIAVAISYVVPQTFTAVTTFLPPQQQQSAAASALASLGALSGLVGAAGALKSPNEQYVSLMQSVSVADRLIDQFGLMKVYDARYRFEARKELARNVRIGVGKKDGIISIEVDDHDPARAASLANSHVAELRRVTRELALTEAQQRRAFFEDQLKATRDKLETAQQALESSGFNPGALRAEPKAAAESYARLKAETTAAEVRLQTLRRGLAEATPEVQQQLTLMRALREQLARLESSADIPPAGDYVSRYREFKYQETLFDLFARQYELARLDESKEGALIQVIDEAKVPEYKSRPRRAVWAVTAAVFGTLLIVVGVTLRHMAASLARTPAGAHRRERLIAALKGRT